MEEHAYLLALVRPSTRMIEKIFVSSQYPCTQYLGIDDLMPVLITSVRGHTYQEARDFLIQRIINWHQVKALCEPWIIEITEGRAGLPA